MDFKLKVELFCGLIEFENVGFVVDVFVFFDIVIIVCDGVEVFVICEFDGFVFVDSDVMFLFDDKDLFVNNVNFSGFVNFVIENDEVLSSDCMFLGMLGIFVFVVINERVSVIGLVELVIVKFED